VLSLDGDGDYVQLPSDIFNHLDEATVEGWIRWETFSTWARFFDFGERNKSMAVARQSGTNDLVFALYDEEGKHHEIIAQGILSEGKWYHIAAVSGGDGMKLHVNGALVGEHPYDGSFSRIGSGANNLLGKGNWERTSSHLNGQLDEIRVWDVARTGEQIRATMFKTLSGDEPDLVSYWRFDDGENIATDSSSNHFDGELFGDAHFVEAELPTKDQLVVLSGIIANPTGQLIPNASVCLEQNGIEIVRTQSDASGSYLIAIFHPVRDLYDLSASSRKLVGRRSELRLREGEEQQVNLTLFGMGKGLWKTYRYTDGLASNEIKDIVQDEDGKMWFGTANGGVSRFDGRCFQTIDTKDGLIDDRVLSLHIDRDGQIWIGTRGGVIRFIPNKVPPRGPYITQIFADDKIYSRPDKPLGLPAGVRRVAISFHAISLKTHPGKMKYFYQLVGKDFVLSDGVHPLKTKDSDWQGPTTQDTVEYFNLKPGKYTFQAQAVDRDLNYSEIVSLELTLPALWHQVGWIRGTLAGGAAIILATLIILTAGYVKRRREVRAYERNAAEELQDAREMQMGLMPDSAPTIEGVEIAGKCVSANTVGGDFFDYLTCQHPNEIGLVVADVCGKGLKGAMNAVMADGVVRMAAKGKEQLSPASLMSEVNDVLKVSMEWGMNITMILALIDTNAKTLTLANAAHHAYPILRRNGEVNTLKTGGMPLGMMAGIKYTEERFQLQSGDVVIFMTDGIIEAIDSENQLYSDSGCFEESMLKFKLDMSAEAMVDAVINDAMDFGSDKGSRDDDMTVVVAKVL